jgi:hypothetical protein
MGATQITQAEYEKIKTLLYHTVPQHIQEDMAAVRVQYIHLALSILRSTDYTRSQSLSLTHLEESQFRAIQGLALKGAPQLPPDFEVA